MKDKLIWCNTKEKLEKVVQKLKDDGFSTTDAERIWESYGAESVLSVHTKYKTITYCSRDWYERRDYATPITADEFLGKSKNPSIVIFRRDRNVIAKNVATGNEGIAKCSPDDEFNFHTGASIALARLMSKTPDALNHDVKDEWIKVLDLTPVKKKVFTDADRNFKVGDRVVVRDWDDMIEEYGDTEGGTIHCRFGFTDTMRHLCGRTATVTVTDAYKGCIKVDFDDKSGDTIWSYSSDMFNPTDIPAQSKTPEAKFKVGDYVTLKEDVEADKWYGGLELLSGAMYDNAHNKRMKVIRADWSDDSNTFFYECKGDSQFTFHYSEEMLDKCDESKIYEGDKVRIKKGCSGMRYDIYYEWVREHITDPDLLLAFERDNPIDTSLDYEVVKIAPHKSLSTTLAYIKHRGCYRTLCYLFNVEALEKV